MSWIADGLRSHTELALFLTLAMGHVVGRIRIGSFRMSPVLGILLSGILVGQLGITVPLSMQWTFFVLFLFATGFKSGPQFFGSLGRDSIPHIGLTVLLCAASVGCALQAARMLGLDAGGAAGLLAGGMNSSAVAGTATDAISRLPIEEDMRQVFLTNLSVVFAVAYISSFITEMFVLTRMGPWLMRIDLAAECRKLEAAMGVRRDAIGVVSSYRDRVARAYRLPEDFRATTADDLERLFAPARVFVERVRRPDGILVADAGTRLRPGDVVALTGRHAVLVGPANPLSAQEVDDRDLLDIPAVMVDVVVTRKGPVGRTLASFVADEEEDESSRSVFVRAITRAGESIPVGLGTVLVRGDVVSLTGPPSAVSRTAARLGKAEWPSVASDMVSVAAAITIGGLLGIPTMRVLGIDVGLTVPVGVLLAGLVVGWLRSVRPLFSRIPEPALWAFDSLGLTGFIAIIGINAGPGFVAGMESAGPAILLAGVVIRLIPNVITLLVGRYGLRMHPGILLGVCAGAGCSSAGLAALNERADSQVPTLGYGVSYAVANVLLGLGGTILVTLLAR